jgi:3-hexulose-6-phosphate synthase
MKFQISYNLPNLSEAIAIAQQSAEYADIIGIGSLLIYKEGLNAIKMFKAAFPQKEIFVEAKIIEKAPDTITMFAQAGATYISILAGAPHSTIKKAIETARTMDIKIALDLLDTQSAGQAAHDAKTIGINMLIINRIPHLNADEPTEIEAEWQNVRGNTDLPIFITGKIDRSNIQQYLDLKPQGIIIGASITRATSPKDEAQFFKSLLQA